VDHAGTGLDEGYDVDPPDRQTLLALDLRHEPIDRSELVGGFDLRHHDAVDVRPHDRTDVAVAELGGDRVDADIAEAGARPLQALDDERPCTCLFADRARILEVENHSVGVERQGLFDAPRVVPGGEEERAENGHGD
jgi:hypothetical protein